MLMMTGLGSGGDNCDPATTWYQSDPNMAYYGSCIPFTPLPTGSTPKTSAASTAPWWQSLVTGVTQGAVKGLVDDQAAPSTMMPIMPQPAPWYTTPVGMIGIGGVAIALFMLLRK